MTANGRPHLAVDLTPMLAGGENGGAKILTLELIEQLGSLAATWDFTLLTAEVCHDQLAFLDRPNIRRLCVLPRPAALNPGIGDVLRRAARGLLSRVPPPVASRAIDLYWAIRHRPRGKTVVDEIGADLLFNPFTAPLYQSRSVPCVSVVYDTQFAAYPQFFSAEERYGREAHLREAAATSVRLVCISDYVRQVLLTQWGLWPQQVVTIPIQLARRLTAAPQSEAAAVLAGFSLEKERFLLYPANFWPHKNHRMLLLAFRQFVEKHPTSRLRLVCTGQPGAAMDELIESARRMGLADRCRFPGFLPDAELAALLGSCRALVFPSLYEGFGMPLIEAMEFDRPILCGDRTALPEVAGDAALYFDPRSPAKMAAAIARIDGDDDLHAELVRRGRDRRRRFADPASMAAAYLEVFAGALALDEGTARSGDAPARAQR